MGKQAALVGVFWGAYTRREPEKNLADLRQIMAWIREGKLKPNSDWNKDLQIKFTVQDPCQIIRKTFGDTTAENLRYVVKSIVGEENFIDMYPNRSNNFCCGGGGGFLQSGYPDERRAYGKCKADQILATKAAYCITPCHNCHGGLEDIIEHYDLGLELMFLGDIIYQVMEK